MGQVHKVRLGHAAISHSRKHPNGQRSHMTIDTVGLKGYWSFEEGVGTTTYDLSKNGNTGTLYGATWATSPIGRALSFDGVDDYVQTPVNLNWAEGTIIAWSNPNDLNNRNLCVYTADNGLTTYTHQMGYRNTNNAAGYLWSGNARNITGTSTVAAGNWYHTAITWKDADAFKLFLNAGLEAQVAIGTAWKSGNKTLIAKNTGTVSYIHNYFNGFIDEFYIYNRVLNATELQNIYNKTR